MHMLVRPIHSVSNASPLLLGLEVVEKDRTFPRLLTPVADDNARAVDDFAGVAFTVEYAY